MATLSRLTSKFSGGSRTGNSANGVTRPQLTSHPRAVQFMGPRPLQRVVRRHARESTFQLSLWNCAAQPLVAVTALPWRIDLDVAEI
jgi:hypothetical protein